MASDVQELFSAWGGTDRNDFPAIHAKVFHTSKGTPYLKEPGVVLIARPAVSLAGVEEFLHGFDEELAFLQYLEDPTQLPPGTQLSKTAGQLCYMSFGPRRTKNDQAQKYIDNIITSGHGSVLEHANYTFLCYGDSRSLTHEQVRHRAGWAYSQVSQRYVSGKVLRFVERPEYQNDPVLHKKFMTRIDRAAQEYDQIAEYLMQKQHTGDPLLSAEYKTDLRKRVQQCARSVLPNETEAPIVLTGNARAWRHVFEMRANEHAEVEIRNFAFRLFLCLAWADPILFGDYSIQELPDGTYAVSTPYPKV